MSALPNARRGESVLHVDGRPLILCLTLGALARLETAFGVNSMTDLEARLRDLSGRDILTVIAALLTGEGSKLSLEDLGKAMIDPAAAVRAIAEAFAHAGDDGPLL